jgi:uncharacterized membrane protein
LKIFRNSYVLSVATALLVASILLGVYYVLLLPKQEGYMTIYVLDSQRKTFDYPELVVAGENSTFSVYVSVENHLANATDVDYQVLLKVTKDMNPSFPVGVNAAETYAGRVKNGETRENTATISLNEPGNYLVVFELWVQEDNAQNTGEFKFSSDFCVLNVQVL